MQRAKNEKLKKQYIDKMLLFLNNKYSRMFKDKKITNDRLRKDVEKIIGNQNFKNFDYQSNLKKVEKSILSKASKIGQIKYEPVQMSKINDLLNFDKDKYLLEESEKNNENIKKTNVNITNNKSKEKTIKTNLDKKQPKNKEIPGKITNKKEEIKKEPIINKAIEENKNIKIRPQSAAINNQKMNLVPEQNINDFSLNNNIVNNNNFSIYNENSTNNTNVMNNLSEKMRKLKLKEQDEWAIKAKLDHDNYIKEQNKKKQEIYEKQMKQRELLENQIKEKKEREEKLYNDKIKKKYEYLSKAKTENELNNDLINNDKRINKNNNNFINDLDNNKPKGNLNQYNINDLNINEELYENIIKNRKIMENNNINNPHNNFPNYNNTNNYNFNNSNNVPMNFNNNINNLIPQTKSQEPQINFISPIVNQYPPNPLLINTSIPQNQYYIPNPQSFQNMPIPSNNIQYNYQLQYPINQNVSSNPNIDKNNINIPVVNQNNFNNSQEGKFIENPSLNNYNNNLQNTNQNPSENQITYPYQELTNRNQFSDYDFRKKSGGDINQYYNEIRMRKQQIRDQYKQIEQENYLNAQKKKEEKKFEKEREKLLKKELNEPPEEMSNLLLREKKLKQKNLIDQIDFTREVRNNEELLKFEKQKKMEDFRKTLDEQVNQKKKMQQIKEMMNNQEKKQDIYEMNQQFIEDVRNIQNRYEDRQEIFMMNNIIGNNNNFNDYD